MGLDKMGGCHYDFEQFLEMVNKAVTVVRRKLAGNLSKLNSLKSLEN